MTRLEDIAPGFVGAGLIIDGVEQTPYVAGTLTWDDAQGLLVEVPYIHRSIAIGPREAHQFAHLDKWFEPQAPTPPMNLLMHLEDGAVTLFDCRMAGTTNNFFRGSAFGRIRAEHVVFAEGVGPHNEPLLVRRLHSRIDGLKEWARLSALTQIIETDEQTGLIKAAVMRLESPEPLRWQQQSARMSISTDWSVDGGNGPRTIHDDVALTSEFDEPRPVEDHLEMQRQVLNLLTILYGAPLRFRSHHVSGPRFAVQYGEKINEPYRRLLTRGTIADHQDPAVPEERLRAPLLSFRAVGTTGLQRWFEYQDQWERVVLPLAGRYRRDNSQVEDALVSAAMALEAAGHLVGSVAGEEVTYARQSKPATATWSFRVFADLGILLPRAGESMVGLARAIANTYNSVKHYDRGRSPDVVESYLAARVAMLVGRLYLAKLVLGRSEAEEAESPTSCSEDALALLRRVEEAFEQHGLRVDNSGVFRRRASSTNSV